MVNKILVDYFSDSLTKFSVDKFDFSYSAIYLPLVLCENKNSGESIADYNSRFVVFLDNKKYIRLTSLIDCTDYSSSSIPYPCLQNLQINHLHYNNAPKMDERVCKT